MNDTNDKQLLSGLESTDKLAPDRSRRIEEETWDRWQGAQRRGKQTRRIIIFASLFLAIGVAGVYSAGAISGDNWLEDFFQHIHAHLYAFHKMIFGK